MTLKTDLAEALVDLFADEEFGEQIHYKGVAIQAIVDIGQDPADQPGAVVTQGNIEVKIADVAEPKIYDPLVIRGQAWQVRRVISTDFMSHLVEIFTDEKPKPRRP